MTEEKRKVAKEKQRLRMQKKRIEIKKKHSDEAIRKNEEASRPQFEWRDGRKDRERIYIKNEKEFNILYKRKVRENRTEAEVEYDRIEGLMRKKRQNHDGKQHLLENLAAKQGMRTLRKYGRIKGREFMRRAARDKDEENLWWSFWKKGAMYKDLLSEKRPDLVTKMRERDAQFIRERDADIDRITANRKKEIERQEEREKKEEELDALGRWVYDEGCEDYCWSILDENGQKVLLQDLNQECKGDDDHDPWDNLEIGG